MKNQQIDGDEAFSAIEGRTISKVVRSDNSIEIYFTDKSFINIEVSVPYGGCSVDHGEDYCYCSSPDADITPYFNFVK
jgi:hypothetical protein